MLVLLLFIGLLLGGALIIVWNRIRRTESSSRDQLASWMLEFQKNLADLRSQIQDQNVQLGQKMQDQMKHNSDFLHQTQQGYRESVTQLQHRLGQLYEATQSMMAIGKDINSLQNILQSPKMRGNLGELLLAELLKQILPEENFRLQYSFRSGAIVDGAILLGDGMIPVDAKFPLENFKRILEAENEQAAHQARKQFFSDVKKHVDSIASKYILPDEGTFEFALMYIPAENVYYETIIKDEMQAESLATYALSKKVIPVSPNSFYAYLQAIVRGLKGLRIERSAKMILENLGQLEGDFERCLTEFEKVGTHLSNAQSAYARAEKKFEKLHGKLSTIEQFEGKELIAEEDSAAASP